MSCKVLSTCTSTLNQHLDVDEDLFSHYTNHYIDPNDELWCKIKDEARSDIEEEPILESYYFALVIRHPTLESALSSYLSEKLGNTDLLPCNFLQDLFNSMLAKYPDISNSIRADLRAARDRDPSCSKMVHCFLYYKGFLALQAYRISHRLWNEDRKAAALLLQSRVSEVFAVDIHPGAKIGYGVLLDHATGIVIGETAEVGNFVSIFHAVTLGDTGKDSGERHPRIGDGVLIGAGSNILGSVSVGEDAKIGAGSVVISPVPPRTTAVGIPARLVGQKENPVRFRKKSGLAMDDHTLWSDYII